MKQKNTKHSKFKNTGVLFELLVRQITSDTLKGIKSSPAIKILEEFFNSKTNIRKEMQMYHTLQNEKFNTEMKANRFIDAVIREFRKVNKTALRKEKYNLIREIKKNYNLESFFKTKISNYKLNASIAKTLDEEYTNPGDKVRSRYTIIENVNTSHSKKYNVEKLTLYQTNKDGSVCKHSCKYYFYYRPESNFLSLAMSNMACSFTSIEKLETV